MSGFSVSPRALDPLTRLRAAGSFIPYVAVSVANFIGTLFRASIAKPSTTILEGHSLGGYLAANTAYNVQFQSCQVNDNFEKIFCPKINRLTRKSKELQYKLKFVSHQFY